MVCSRPHAVNYLSRTQNGAPLQMNRIRRLSLAFAVAGVLGVAAPAAASALGTIDLISRTSVAGVLTNFQTLLLEGKKVSTKAAEEPSEGLMRAKVESDPNSIGFVSNYQSDKGTVHAVGLNGVQCNKPNVVSG